MAETDDKLGDVFELTDSEYILNLEFYLHRGIIKWQDALESALKQGKDIDAGLINRGLAGDMVEGIAKAKNIVHWEEIAVPEKDDKHRQNVIRFNAEAKEFNERFAKFKKDLEEKKLSKNIETCKISDYKVFEVLKTISKNSTKKGTVIV